MARAYLEGQDQEWELESGSECPDGLHHVPSADDACGLPHPRSGR